MAVAYSTGAALPLAENPVLQRSRIGTGPLKIRRVEPIILRSPNHEAPSQDLITMPPIGSSTGGAGLWNRLDHASPSRTPGYQHATLVKITTDQDLIGWGECHSPTAPGVHQRTIRDRLAPLLIGQDARNPEALWERMYSSERLRGYATGAYTESIAGVDLALWDILGKYTGLPVYQLLGGKFRDEIPTYVGLRGESTAELAENAVAAMEEGYQVVKMGLRKGSRWSDTSRGDNQLERVTAVVQAIKGRGQVCVDSLGAFKLHEAVQVGRELDRLGNVGWFEDPLMPEDLTGYQVLAEALDTPICAGEGMSNRFQFRDIFAVRGVDVINPDVCRAGGISECKRIAILADAHGVLWSPHVSMGTAVYLAASIHLAVSTPNCVIMEGGNKHLGPFGNVLLEDSLELRAGYARVPERPGLGVNFNETELAKLMVR